MPNVEAPPSHPLQLGQVLYPVQDSTLIYVPKGSSTARFQRVSFKGTQEKPDPVVHDPIDLGSMDDIRNARAVTHWAGGRQEVALLTNSGVSYIAMEDEQEHLETVNAGRDAWQVIGLDPDQPHERVLALLARDRAGYFVELVEVGKNPTLSASPMRLPSQIKGTPLAAELVRRDASAALVVVVLTDDYLLQVHAVAWRDLAPATSKDAVSTLTLGNALNDEAAQVCVAVARMRPRSSDQQLAVTWIGVNGAPNVSLVGWGDDRQFSVLATTTPDTTFAVPERPVYRVAAADLLGRGVDQLVIGYPATHTHHKKVEGCAALMLFELEDDKGSIPVLARRSNYTVADAGDQPLTSYDLHIGAGLFGSCFGIQVIGCGATMADLLAGQASVLCGFVGVTPDAGGLPPMPADGSVAHISEGSRTAGNLLARMNPEARLLGFPSDMAGQSIILGAPHYELKPQCTQILAIVQAAPFDKRTVAGSSGKPQVTIVWSKGSTGGCSVSADVSYTTTKDLSVNMGAGDVFNLSTALHNSYGENFSKVDDTSTTKGMSFHATFDDDDYLLEYEMSFGTWRYPVLSNSEQLEGIASDSSDVPAEVIVVVPHQSEPSQMWRPARTYAYRPRSEVGMLLSYVDVKPEHYAEQNLLFSRQGSMVETGTVTATYDESDMTAASKSKHISVVNSLSSHLGFSGGTELFEVLPITFGLNMGMSWTDSNSKVDTTHIMNHTAMSVGVSFGQVREKKHEFSFTPVIYQHAELGCLMLAWDVPLPSGGAWTSGAVEEDPELTSPNVCLLRLEPDAGDPVERAFSRSFYFAKGAGDKVSISVEIFNNGILPAEDVYCDFYLGRPELSYDTKLKKKFLKLPGTMLGRVPMEGALGGAKRTTIKLGELTFSERPAYVTVRLKMGEFTGDDNVFWGEYVPKSSF